MIRPYLKFALCVFTFALLLESILRLLCKLVLTLKSILFFKKEKVKIITAASKVQYEYGHEALNVIRAVLSLLSIMLFDYAVIDGNSLLLPLIIGWPIIFLSRKICSLSFFDTLLSFLCLPVFVFFYPIRIIVGAGKNVFKRFEKCDFKGCRRKN